MIDSFLISRIITIERNMTCDRTPLRAKHGTKNTCQIQALTSSSSGLHVSASNPTD